MSRINQPPAPILTNAGRTNDVGTKTKAAPQPAAAQPQGRAAVARDGFTTQAAAPMVLNPRAQAQATRREVLPGAEKDFKKPPTRDELLALVDKAFKEQYGKNATATGDFMNQWVAEAQRIFEKDGTSQFLFEKVFAEMNKAVAAGRTSPLPETDFKKPPTPDELKAAVEFAFKQQFNEKPTENELTAWVAEAQRIFERDGTTQFLAEKVFSALNKAVSGG